MSALRTGSQFGGAAGVDVTANYNWTGIHTHAATPVFNAGITIAQNQRLNFDTDLDSYLIADIDDRIRHYTGGNPRLTIENTGITWSVGFNMLGNNITNIGQLRMDEIARPAAIANHGQLYTVDTAGVAEVFGQDDGGVQTQLTSHNKVKEWIHKSQNIKTDRELFIKMEKFMFENYPQYVMINNKPLTTEILPNGGYPIIQKPKWYQLIKRFRLWYND